MGPFSRAMELYPYAVHPITVLGVGILALVHHEWARQGADAATLWRRVAGFLAAGLLSLAPTAAYFLVTGEGVVEATQGNAFVMDALVGSGLLVAAGLTWGLWRRFEWGSLVPGAMEAVAAVAVPYVALSAVWNVSGHVIVALVATLYLTLVDRKFWPTLVAPAVMVPNRIYLGAHTWAQTVGGVVVAGVVVGGIYWLQTGGSMESPPESIAG
jgi:membrane-associated phospholipid phosphatase